MARKLCSVAHRFLSQEDVQEGLIALLSEDGLMGGLCSRSKISFMNSIIEQCTQQLCAAYSQLQVNYTLAAPRVSHVSTPPAPFLRFTPQDAFALTSPFWQTLRKAIVQS